MQKGSELRQPEDEEHAGDHPGSELEDLSAELSATPIHARGRGPGRSRPGGTGPGMGDRSRRGTRAVRRGSRIRCPRRTPARCGQVERWKCPSGTTGSGSRKFRRNRPRSRPMREGCHAEGAARMPWRHPGDGYNLFSPPPFLSLPPPFLSSRSIGRRVAEKARQAEAAAEPAGHDEQDRPDRCDDQGCLPAIQRRV